MSKTVDHQRKTYEVSVEARVKARTKEIETKNFHLNRTNESLRQQLFDYRQREAEFDSVRTERDHLLKVVDKMKHDMDSKADESRFRLEKARDVVTTAMNQLSEVKKENARLLELVNSSTSCATKAVPPSRSQLFDPLANDNEDEPESSTVTRLRSELKALRVQYDRLEARKRKVSEGWRADTKKWKSFKQYVLANKENAKMAVEFQNFMDNKTSERSCVSDSDEPRDTPGPRSAQRGLPLSSQCTPTAQKTSVARANADNSQVSASSATQDWSYTSPPEPQLRGGDDSQHSPVIAIVTRESIARPSQPDIGSDAVDKEGPSAVMRTPRPRSSHLEVAKAAVPPAIPEKSINALFEINADRNDGVRHQFADVVRNHEERRQLHGGDCECCREYYEAVGPLPTRLEAPLWATPPKGGRAGQGISVDEDSPTRIQQHKQDVSRHRQQWQGPQTPPDFWEIGFPDTQQVAAINERAANMHRVKRRRIEEEADRPNGMYKRKVGGD